MTKNLSGPELLPFVEIRMALIGDPFLYLFGDAIKKNDGA